DPVLRRRVDGQQRVVGDHYVRLARRLARLLRETIRAVRTTLRAEALLRADRDLPPRRLGDAGDKLVAVSGRGLVGPFVQAFDLTAERGYRICWIEQRIGIVVGDAAALAIQA